MESVSSQICPMTKGMSLAILKLYSLWDTQETFIYTYRNQSILKMNLESVFNSCFWDSFTIFLVQVRAKIILGLCFQNSVPKHVLKCCGGYLRKYML